MNFLARNIKHIRSLKNLSQEQFGDDLSVSRSRISSYEENRATPPVDFLVGLSDYFKIPIDILIKNDLSKSEDDSFIEIGQHRVLFPITVDGTDEDLIEIVPVEASAGYLRGYADPEYIEHLNKIKLPFLPTGTHRAFPIKGDSMLPVKSGSYVVARFIEDVRDVRNGKTYIVLTLNDGLVYKRVYDHIEEHGTLLLASDNKKYDPYHVPVDEIMELWEFTCSINTQEYEEHELKISSIANMFNELGVELKSLERLVS
ncbi:MAG: XRE family transcriptional regulator [Bacteroidetes bacterium MedPE-SWsnd-G1]|uniref:Helix-turn-helix domain-containing protein n=1 Tax=Urechidicola vernalis TaxID=3075600 RepID=A0ABU2Y0E2_9FLAO|nr:helix-turn-helix domain-containing protein [Urechidicola sp. P050]MDT0551617.1 helix-turn-helix domain-containing protein [Urechidicola sp. P050]OIQ37894.1 MAG: XRE family transcriptional regulator [Bacteroidetes bacterium MedPE-SWsnd-G1]